MELYNEIKKAIYHHVQTLRVGDEITVDIIRLTIRQIMLDNPDLFWFAYQWKFVDQVLHFRYPISETKTNEIKRQITDIVHNDFQIDKVRQFNDLEKVFYVYRWLIQNCNYNIHSAYNQNIYSVFVLRNSMCTGYAKAAQYLFGLLKIESKLVYGILNTTNGEGRHCWNLVKIDGSYYHLDICLGDPSLDYLLKDSGVDKVVTIDGINYNMFCVSTEEVSKSRTIDNIGDLPETSSSLSQQQILELVKLPIFHRDDIKGCLLSSKGSTSDIYLCSKDKKVVLKCYRDLLRNQCVEEYRFLDRLRACPHLLHVKDEYCNVENGVIAIEQAVPVKELLMSPDSLFSLKDALRMAKDIALAVDECYMNSVFYVDIHLNNVYIHSNGVYKLGDMGSCCWAVQTNSLANLSNVEGSPWFMAPETYTNGIFNMNSATYSISLLLYYILNGLIPPFVDKYPGDGYEKRVFGKTIPPLTLYEFDQDVATAINAFLGKGLSFSEKSRYRGIQEYVSCIDQLFITIGKRDYLLRFSVPERSFKTEIVTITEENNTSIDTVTASIECPNCHSIYDVDIARDLVDDLKHFLECDPACGAIGILRSTADSIVCPNCHYETTITDCINNKILTIQQENKRNYDKTSCFSFDKTNVHKGDVLPSNNVVLCDIDFFDSFACTMRMLGFDKLKPLDYRRTKMKSWFKHLFTSSNCVYSSVFAPAEVNKNSHLLVQLYFHKVKETERVKGLAKESQKNAERRDYILLESNLKEGNKVDITLNIYGNTLLRSEKKSIVWRGVIAKCSFDYFIPENININDLLCVAILSVDNAQVGELRFVTRIVEQLSSSNDHAEVFARHYEKIFISYAHQDESKVKYIARAYEAQGVDYFFDRHYLKPGDIFPLKIKQYINSADLFILCWSENAAKSDYVDLERKQALERAFPKDSSFDKAPLSIYPLSIEPHAELPDDMKNYYHFGVL